MGHLSIDELCDTIKHCDAVFGLSSSCVHIGNYISINQLSLGEQESHLLIYLIISLIKKDVKILEDLGKG